MKRPRPHIHTPVDLLADGLLLWVLLGSSVFSFSTAFDLAVENRALLFGALLFTLFYLAVFSLPIRYGFPLLIAGVTGMGLLLWQVRTLTDAGWASIQCAVVNAYAQVFPGIQEIMPIAQLSQEEWRWAVTLFLLSALLVLGYLIGWALLSCRSFWRTACLSVLPLVPALAAGRLPHHISLTFLLGGLAVLLWAGLVRARYSKHNGLVTLGAAAPVALVLALLTALISPASYQRPAWAVAGGTALTNGFTALTTGLDLSGLRLLPGGKGLTAAGSSSHVDLSSDALTFDGHTVLHVETDYVGQLYLRGYSAAVYENNAWSPLPQEAYEGWISEEGSLTTPGTAFDLNANPLNLPALTAGNTPYYAITVENRSAPGGCVYLPYQPLSRPGELSGAQFQDDASLARALLVRTHTLYFRPAALDLTQCVPLSGEAAQAEQAYAAQFVPTYYLQLPDGMVEELERHCQAALELHMPGGRVENENQLYLAAAQAVADYLKGLASYDLTASPPPDGSDYVLYFLNESHRGYCMQFASAGTLMLRAMGIPARYVSGFAAYSQGGSTDVPDSAAHAWVEIYLSGYGWYPVDMTPGYSLSTQTQTSATPQPSATPSPSPTPSAPVSAPPSAQPQTPQTSSQPHPEAVSPFDLKLLLIPALLLGLIGGVVLRRVLCRSLRRRRFAQKDPNQSVKALYRYVRALERRGAPPLPVCYAMAQQAAFSREGVTAEECDRLRHQVTDYAEAFQTSLSRTQRFILRWLWALV